MTARGPAKDVLVLNAGSSSIKFAVFDSALNERLSGIAEGIGADGSLRVGTAKAARPFKDHAEALQAVLSALESHDLPVTGFRAAGHRVVHGGTAFSGPALLTPQTLATLAQCTPLAPLHNPHNLAAIETLMALAPDLPQTATFDTAFHATNPEVALRYAVDSQTDARGIRRYGFHGTSYASLVQLLPQMSGGALPARLLAFHLGNGASACAIRDGRSVATTMGYSPLGGLTMGSRTGDIDGNAVLRLAREDGIEATHRQLNHDSGLKALSGGLSDMRALLDSTDPNARFAIDHFCYWAQRHAGSLIAAMGGLDAVVFTGGIGENAPSIRAGIASGLEWLGLHLNETANTAGSTLISNDASTPCWIIPAREERMIAEDALALVGA